MMHFTPRAARGTILFRDWVEAGRLWRAIVSRVPAVTALVLMPDHVHLLAPPEAEGPLGRALRAYALARNHARGASGAVWSRDPYATRVANRVHARRTVRYIYLNPVRAGLVADPLAWPFSTLRDSLGLAIPPARRPVARPEELLAYVGQDADAGLVGCPIPAARPGSHPPAAVLRATSSLTRLPVAELRDSGPHRRRLLAALRALTDLSASEIARFTGVSVGTVRRVPARIDADAARIARVCDDPRFFALEPGRLPWTRDAPRP